MAHVVWGNAKELWMSERAVLVLHMWHRYTVYRSCRRTGVSSPVFAVALEQWDRFVEAFEDRQLRLAISKRLVPLVRERPPVRGKGGRGEGQGGGWERCELCVLCVL